MQFIAFAMHAQDVFFEVCAWIGFFFYSIFYAAYKTLIPAGLLPGRDLTGKVVLLTGAGGGIGRVTAIKFAQAGCTLHLWDVAEEANEETARLCREAFPDGVDARAVPRVVDLTDSAAIRDSAKEIGPVDVLINNAGLLNNGDFFEVPDATQARLVAVNALAPMFLTKAVVPGMLERGTGHVVTIASVAGVFGARDLVDYSLSKFAALGFVEALEHTLADRGRVDVAFTTVCPIFVRTAMIEQQRLPSFLPVIDAEVVAGSILDAVVHRRRFVILPAYYRLVLVLKYLLPRNLFASMVLYKRIFYD